MAEVTFVNLPDEKPLVYVNAWKSAVSSHDFTLELGDVVNEQMEDKIARSSVKIVMTHATLLMLASQLSNMAGFVVEMYGGAMPSFPVNIDAAKIAEMNAKYGDIVSINKK